MKTSNAGKLFIKSFESFRPSMYIDQAGHPTIGYGHLIESDDPNKYMIREISLQEGEKIFDFDLYYKSEQFINFMVHDDIFLAQHEYDALASLVFNIGGGNFATSTLLKKLNRGEDKIEIADEFLKWNKITIKGKKVPSEGLTRRRQKERKMFLGEEFDL